MLDKSFTFNQARVDSILSELDAAFKKKGYISFRKYQSEIQYLQYQLTYKTLSRRDKKEVESLYLRIRH